MRTASKKTSLNSVSSVIWHLAQRTHLDPGSAHVDRERGDPLLLRDVWVGAGEAEAPVGELRIARPHLLAVEHPFTVVVIVVGGRPVRAHGSRRE
jgi:hypothetical protein